MWESANVRAELNFDTRKQENVLPLSLDEPAEVITEMVIWGARLIVEATSAMLLEDSEWMSRIYVLS